MATKNDISISGYNVVPINAMLFCVSILISKILNGRTESYCIL